MGVAACERHFLCLWSIMLEHPQGAQKIFTNASNGRNENWQGFSWRFQETSERIKGMKKLGCNVVY